MRYFCYFSGCILILFLFGVTSAQLEKRTLGMFNSLVVPRPLLNTLKEFIGSSGSSRESNEEFEQEPETVFVHDSNNFDFNEPAMSSSINSQVTATLRPIVTPSQDLILQMLVANAKKQEIIKVKLYEQQRYLNLQYQEQQMKQQQQMREGLELKQRKEQLEKTKVELEKMAQDYLNVQYQEQQFKQQQMWEDLELRQHKEAVEKTKVELEKEFQQTVQYGAEQAVTSQESIAQARPPQQHVAQPIQQNVAQPTLQPHQEYSVQQPMFSQPLQPNGWIPIPKTPLVKNGQPLNQNERLPLIKPIDQFVSPILQNNQPQAQLPQPSQPFGSLTPVRPIQQNVKSIQPLGPLSILQPIQQNVQPIQPLGPLTLLHPIRQNGQEIQANRQPTEQIVRIQQNGQQIQSNSRLTLVQPIQADGQQIQQNGQQIQQNEQQIQSNSPLTLVQPIQANGQQIQQNGQQIQPNSSLTLVQPIQANGQQIQQNEHQIQSNSPLTTVQSTQANGQQFLPNNPLTLLQPIQLNGQVQYNGHHPQQILQTHQQSAPITLVQPVQTNGQQINQNVQLIQPHRILTLVQPLEQNGGPPPPPQSFQNPPIFTTPLLQLIQETTETCEERELERPKMIDVRDPKRNGCKVKVTKVESCPNLEPISVVTNDFPGACKSINMGMNIVKAVSRISGNLNRIIVRRYSRKH